MSRFVVFFFFLFFIHKIHLSSQCEVSLSPLDLEPSQYNGSWFVVAHKASDVRRFLPLGVSSSLIRLQIDQDKLNMTEYHSINGTCMPPLSGVWTKKNDEYIMELRTDTGYLFTMSLRAIYHGYSGEQNEEMNMVIHGCPERDYYGNCAPGEEMMMIMSNSRHPQTLELFKSAKLIEDTACVDILHFKVLETYTLCGDDVVDEDQKLEHAAVDENNEFVDVECKVGNIRPETTNISHFFDEPRVLTVIAYIDPTLNGEQIAHISCVYTSRNSAVCEWIRKFPQTSTPHPVVIYTYEAYRCRRFSFNNRYRLFRKVNVWGLESNLQNTCHKTNLTQTVTAKDVLIDTSFLTVNGSVAPLNMSGTVLWENGDEYISMHCLVVDEDGACDSHRIYVWSDEDHMDQPTINEIQRQLQAVCVDPTDLAFLNTFHECSETNLVDQNPSDCGPTQGWNNVSPHLLYGVWYIAADLNADPKIFLQTAVILISPMESTNNSLSLKYYAQKEADGECVGPGEGNLTLNGSLLEVTVEYSYTLVPTFKNTMKWSRHTEINPFGWTHFQPKFTCVFKIDRLGTPNPVYGPITYRAY